MTIGFSQIWLERMGELAGQPNYFIDKILKERLFTGQILNINMKTLTKTLTIILLLLFTTATAQRKDDTAHVFAGLTIHGGSYFLLSATQIKGKEWIPFVAVNVVGVGKELIDNGQPDNRFSGMDLVYNNIGAGFSWLMIKGLRAVGVPENVAVGSVVSVGIIGLGLTINF